MEQIETASKTTWKPLTDLSKAEMVRMYDALSQTKNREAIMRRMIHYPPEHETVFANLIRRVNRIFEDNECPSANYKTKCYKELKHVLNEFQGDLFTDSGESVRFTTTTRLQSPQLRQSPQSPQSPPSPPSSRFPDPAPVQLSNLILNMPDWKRIRFAEMILERNADEEKTNFIKKYVYAIYDDGEPFPGLLHDVIVDCVHISNADLDIDTKIKFIRSDLEFHKTIYILYPFPSKYSNVFRSRSVRRGGKRRSNQRTNNPILHRKSNKGRRRVRSRGSRRASRRMKIKGGLSLNDSENIRLRGTYSFENQADQQAFKMFTFGTQMQCDAWTALLTTCLGKIPVYILTSGNKVGIIRTLQLLGLDGYFNEVLCTGRNGEAIPATSTKPAKPAPPPINPPNLSGRHNFEKQHKYEVIQQIMEEHGFDCQGPLIGYLLDDGAHNDDPGLCPAIQFNNVLTRVQTDFDMAALMANPIYKLNVTKMRLHAIDGPSANFNFTSIETINEMKYGVVDGRIKILFVDFDKTFQIWERAVPFEHPAVLRIFADAGAPINVA